MENTQAHTLVPSSREIPNEPMSPRITRRGVGIVASVWSVYTLLAAFPLMQSYQTSFFQALYWQVSQSVVMCVLSVPVWFIVIRMMHGARWYWKGAVHLLLAPTYAVMAFAYLYYMVQWFGGETSAKAILKSAGWLLYFNFMIYILQFALYHSYEILRKLRINETITLQLLGLKTEQELSTLKAQINPHFLFNTLNSISAMAGTDAEETRTMIAQLSDLLRYAIDSSKKEFISLDDELQFIHAYIALETRRMGERLAATFQVDSSLASFKVPPMILQPLVENAIKHGIAPNEEGGSVFVEIHKEGNGIVFRISNTGIGLTCTDPLHNSDGVGLKNTDDRLRKIFGESSGLTIQSREDCGCEVTFRLPLE
jgi:two-component system, LytTR family, sensor kinase